MPKPLGEPQAFPHEGQPDTEVLPFGMHHQGAEQQCGRSGTANGQRPKADGSCQANLRIADHQRQAIGRRAPFPQTVGGFDPALDAKGNIEQLLNEGLIRFFRGFDGK